MITLVLSDLHLMPAVRTSGTVLTGDCEFAITQIAETFRSVKPNVVVIAGDVFDQPLVGNEELALFRKLMEAMPSVPKLAIQGNHDPGKHGIPDVCFGCTDLDTETVEVEGVRFGGVKYRADDKGMKKLIAAKSEECDVLVTHASTAPFANFGAKLTPDDFSPKPLNIVGDTHVSKYYNRGGKRILSPGYLYPTRKNEFLGQEPGIVILEGTGPFKVYKMPLKRRYAIDVLEREWNAETIAEVRKHEKDALKPLVYASVDQKPDVARDVPFAEIATAVKVRKIDDLPVIVTGKSDSVVDRIREAANTLLKDNPDKDEVVQLLVDLWNSNDPEGVLKAKLEVGNEAAS